MERIAAPRWRVLDRRRRRRAGPLRQVDDGTRLQGRAVAIAARPLLAVRVFGELDDVVAKAGEVVDGLVQHGRRLNPVVQRGLRGRVRGLRRNVEDAGVDGVRRHVAAEVLEHGGGRGASLSPSQTPAVPEDRARGPSEAWVTLGPNRRPIDVARRARATLASE